MTLTDSAANTRPNHLRLSPLADNQNSFKSHRLVMDQATARVVRTTRYKLFISAFVGPGLAALGLGLPYHALGGRIEGVVFMILFGAMFLGASWFLFANEGLMVLDRARGIYYRDRLEDAGAIVDAKPEQAGPLQQVEGLQLLQHEVTPEGSETRKSYTCYELNLVLGKGKRANVLSMGDRDAIVQVAEELSAFLGVSTWSELS